MPVHQSRIAVVARSFPEVSQTFVLDHVAGLLERAHDVRVFAEPPRSSAPLHAEYTALGMAGINRHWPRLPAAPLARLQALATQLRRLPARSALAALLSPEPHNALIGRGRGMLLRAAAMQGEGAYFDLVHAHFAAQGEVMGWFRKHGLLRAPLVVSLHGFDVTRPNALQQKPYPLMCRYADRFIVTTAFMQAQAQEIGCPPEKIVRLPIGIRVRRFPFIERRWLPGEPLRLLSIARLVEKKGIAHALRAVAEVTQEGVRIEYRIVGDGPLRESLQNLAAELGIGQQVRFEGACNREQTLRHLQDCHLFVFPSCRAADGDQEGQGIVAQEAQACGIPVLATRHGGIPEGVEEGLSAVLVAEADAAALARGLRELIARHQHWGDMGRAGRRWVESHFDHDYSLDRLLGVYRELGVPSPPASTSPARSRGDHSM